MRKITDYRNHGAECRELAAKAATSEQREALLDMAKTWDMLANERLRTLDQKERLKAMGQAAD